LQIFSKHVTEGLDLHPSDALPPPPAATTAPAPAPPPAAARGDPSWGNLISFMEGGAGPANTAGSPSSGGRVKARAGYHAALHAQALALSRSDKAAEEAAMQRAEESAEDDEVG
jgi:hypothetical protein